MPAWALKVGATALTLLAAVGSAGFVTAHVRPASAPMHPAVMGAARSDAVSGRLTILPSVHSADVRPVTSTYAS